MRYFVQLIVIGSVFSATALAAHNGEVFPLNSKDSRLQIQVPEGYSQKTPPKPTIKIEAVNEATAAVVLVISEPQTRFASLAEYAGIVRDQISARLKDPQSDAGEKVEADGYPAVRYEITGVSSTGLRMAFLVTVIQSETRFNQVVGSCIRPNFAEGKAEFAKIANSFKELPAK